MGNSCFIHYAFPDKIFCGKQVFQLHTQMYVTQVCLLMHTAKPIYVNVNVHTCASSFYENMLTTEHEENVVAFLPADLM